MSRRGIGIAVLLLCPLVGCGNPASGPLASDLASGADDLGASGDDLAAPDDLAVPADLGMLSDLSAVIAPDLAVADDGGSDGGNADAGGSSTPVTTVLSPATRPSMGCPVAAAGAGGSLFLWTQSDTTASVFSNLTSFAYLPNGGTPIHGAAPVGGTTCSGAPRLLPFGSSFLYPGSIVNGQSFIFDGTKWTAVGGIGNSQRAVSGAAALVFDTDSGPAAYIYDGSGNLVSTETLPTLYQVTFGAGGDGSGSFGIAYVTGVFNGTGTINFRSYNGTTWSAAETVGTLPLTGSEPISSVHVSGGAGTWAVSWLGAPSSLTALSPLNVAVRTGAGSWTTSTLTNTRYDYVVTGDSATLAVGAIDNASNAQASIYASGSWSSTVLDNTVQEYVFGVQSTSAGHYVMTYGIAATYNYAAKVAVFDGTSWTTPIAVGAMPSVAVSSAGIGVVSSTTTSPFDTQATIYAGSAWSSALTLNSGTSTGGTIVPTSGGFLAGFVEPGLMVTRSYSPTTWAAESNLPCDLEQGAVERFSVAERSDGHALALFSQYDAGNLDVYAAEFDGTQWGAAVQVGTTSATTFVPQVVASSSSFLLHWPGSGEEFAIWAGASTTPTAVVWSGANPPLVASDGTTFLAAFATSAGVQFSTSSDGLTWSTPAAVETSGWSPLALVGSSAGYALVSQNGTQSNTRVYQSGSWSAPATMTVNTTCAVAAAGATFLSACSGTTLDAQWWSGGSFTDVPVSASAASGFALGANGAGYRIQYGGSSAVFSGGSWSAAKTETNLTGLPTYGLVPAGGGWRLLTKTSQELATASASGGSIFGAPAAFETSTRPIDGELLSAGPTRVDAVWTQNTGGQHLQTAVLSATTGL